jgi:hypothetical protein
VELFKNMPLTIIMVFMVLGAYAQLKISFSDNFRRSTSSGWPSPVCRLYTAAFVCESLRSGINTVPLGQAEAARALGLSFTQASPRRSFCRRPSVGRWLRWATRFIALLKNSTVAAAASVASETSSLMSEMIEFHADVIVSDLPHLRVRIRDTHHPNRHADHVSLQQSSQFGGDASMNATHTESSMLFDQPGPKGRRTIRIHQLAWPPAS